MAGAPQARQTVRRLLAAAPAYARLPARTQRQLARDMTDVATYMADPDGLLSREARQPLLARQPARPLLGHGADAVLLQAAQVDFPEFVRALVQGVFQSIVESSIRQMEAYAALVAAVAASVDQFRQDHITDQQARDSLAETFPDLFCGQRVRPDAAAASRLQAALGLQRPPADLRQAVAGARRRLALQRQQLLATMVLMGVNRIAVGDGRPDACLPFEALPRPGRRRSARQ